MIERKLLQELKDEGLTQEEVEATLWDLSEELNQIERDRQAEEHFAAKDSRNTSSQ